MNKFFEDTMQGLLEAIEMERGNIPIVEKEDMPTSTFTIDSQGISELLLDNNGNE